MLLCLRKLRGATVSAGFAEVVAEIRPFNLIRIMPA